MGADHGRALQQLGPGRLQLGRGPRRRGLRAQVGDRLDPHPHAQQRQRVVQTAVVDGRHHRARARPDAVHGTEAAGAAGQHHPGQVVVSEDERLLDGPGRDDVPGGPHLVQRRPLPDGDEAVEEAERDPALDDLDARAAGRGDQLGRARGAPLGQQQPAGHRVLVAEHDVEARLGRHQRGAEARDAAADHEHVAVAPPILGLPAALALAGGEAAEAGGAAQDLLVERPQPPWADERLVVEAHRRERSAELVDRPHDVELERRPRVLVPHAHALGDRLGAGADPGAAVDVDERVGALAAGAQLTAGTVVLERAGERPATACVQRARDRVAGVAGDALAVEAEADRA